MKRYNIVTRRTYEKDGQEKTQWLRVGTLAQFPPTAEKEESFIMELNMFPHTKLFLFEAKKKEDKAEEKGEADAGEIGEEEVPF